VPAVVQFGLEGVDAAGEDRAGQCWDDRADGSGPPRRQRPRRAVGNVTQCIDLCFDASAHGFANRIRLIDHPRYRGR